MKLKDAIPSNRVWKPGDRVGKQPIDQTPKTPWPRLGTVQQVMGGQVIVRWDDGNTSTEKAANLSREHHILGRSP